MQPRFQKIIIPLKEVGLNDNKPIAELYNTIHMTMNKKWKNSLTLNEHGLARTKSRNIANKIWVASDWTALLTDRENVKQINLAMVLHRILQI